MQIECFLTNLYSIDVMAPFCLELQKKGYKCNLALDELFWKVSYGEHFDVDEAIKQAKKWGVKLNLKLNYGVDIAVTQWRVDWALFGVYKNLKAKISYGVSLRKGINFARGDKRFDYYFVHGEFEKEQLLNLGIEENRIIKIGFPKLKHEKSNCYLTSKKKILTYFSTWDEFNNIEFAVDLLKKLQSEYQIYIKPHPLQREEELEKLKKFSVLNCNIKSLVKHSDVILFDLKSGSIAEILYWGSNKTIIGICEDKKNYYEINYLDKVLEYDNELKIPKKVKNKNKLKNYLISEKMDNLDFHIVKISPTIQRDELDFLQERLKKTYKEFYKG